jgi:diacylglycerol kinase (ATP)
MDSSQIESPHKGKTGLRRMWNAMFYSIEGLKAAYRHEDAFRQEVLLAVLLIPLALFLPAPGLGKALMIASVLLVLIVELLNSAVEATVDRVSLEHHRLAKQTSSWSGCWCCSVEYCSGMTADTDRRCLNQTVIEPSS